MAFHNITIAKKELKAISNTKRCEEKTLAGTMFRYNVTTKKQLEFCNSFLSQKGCNYPYKVHVSLNINGTFTNLVENHVKFTPSFYTITI